MLRRKSILSLVLLVFSLIVSCSAVMLCGCDDDTQEDVVNGVINPKSEYGRQIQYYRDQAEGKTSGPIIFKPIIYLYPQEETSISVILAKENNLTCSYPKYQHQWDVIAQPNGDLIDKKTGRNLYSLYYECQDDIKFEVKDDGFIITGKDTAGFLEEKLAILGLTEREAEEFIVYWLPKLEANEYNYVRFATSAEIDENMPLEITPTPDTTIRILMTFKGLDAPISVEEQVLTSVDRTGFVAVEWGGTEIS